MLRYDNMKNKELYSTLYDCCRWNMPDKFSQLLDKNIKDIDLTHDEGLFFRMAISHNMKEILNILLQHYEKTQLSSDPETLEYKFSKHKLINILQDAVDAHDVSNEIQEILKPYILTGESDEDSNREIDDFDDLSLALDTEKENLSDESFSSIELTEDNLKQFNSDSVIIGDIHVPEHI